MTVLSCLIWMLDGIVSPSVVYEPVTSAHGSLALPDMEDGGETRDDDEHITLVLCTRIDKVAMLRVMIVSVIVRMMFYLRMRKRVKMLLVIVQ